MTDPRPPRLRLGPSDCIGARLSLLDDAGAQHVVSTVGMQRRLARNEVVHARLRIPMREVRATIGTFVAFGAVFIATIVLTVLLPEEIGVWLIVPVPLFIPLGLGAGAAYTASRFRRRSREYARLMKARALCPACIRPLDGLTVPDDGLVECPECRARWKFGESGHGVSARWCSGCGYSLEGLPSDEAGSITCPECGVVSHRAQGAGP